MNGDWVEGMVVYGGWSGVSWTTKTVSYSIASPGVTSSQADNNAQNGGGVGWEAWAGATGVYSWGLREFYYGPKVRGLSQYYGQSESVRLNASRTRNAITARTQSLTPQPLRLDKTEVIVPPVSVILCQ